MKTSAFEILGLPVSYSVNPVELETRYLFLSRCAHPDHHDPDSGKSLEQSMRESAALNDAHKTLEDPILRAEHLLALWGGPDATADKSMAPEFLEAMLEWREQAEDPAEAAKLLPTLQRRFEEGLVGLGKAFARAGEDAPERPLRMKEIRSHLNQLRSLRGLLREIEESQDSF